MSDKRNTYSFLPWVREGIANEINNDGTNDKLRATIDVEFKIKGSGGSESEHPDLVYKKVSLYGPGDVIGIDAKTIIKTEPRNWITNFEPNYLPCIDFYDEDFPWRYSPDMPNNDQGRLLPWIALVVLEEGTFEEGNDITDKPLPYFKLNDGKLAKDVFQPIDQLWAWAHVHVNKDLITGDEGDDAETITSTEMDSVIADYKSLLEENPDNAYSRIMCPIKLKENTAYHAFLIPSFESGRLAGLGMDVEGVFNDVAGFFDNETNPNPYTPTTLAWASDIDGIDRIDADTFPIYHRWYFRTGNAGDFEYLVRLLEPQLVDSRVGTRNMDVTNPGSGVDGINDNVKIDDDNFYPSLGGVLRLGGALKIPAIAIKDKVENDKYENWDQPYPRKFQRQLAAFINLSDDYSKKSIIDSHSNEELQELIEKMTSELPDDKDPDPMITPPLYGCWHSLSKRLLMDDDKNPDDNWVHQINLDPRHRATSGFGTKIVQKNQETYMEAAWEQVGDIVEANLKIRQAQLARFAALIWYKKYMEPLRIKNQGAYIGLTQPVHKRMVSEVPAEEGKTQSLTINYQVKTSKVPGIIFTPSIRTFTRPGARIAKTLKFDPLTNPIEKLAERINKDEVLPAPPKKLPEGVKSLDGLSNALKPKRAPGFLLRWIEKYHWLKWVVLGVSLALLLLLAIFVGPNLSNITPGLGSLSGVGMFLAIMLIYLFYLIVKWEKQLHYAPILQEKNQTPEAIEKFPMKPEFNLTVAGAKIDFKTGGSDSIEGKRFRTALIDAAELLQANIAATVEETPPPLLLDSISLATSKTLNPLTSIPKYINTTQVNIPERIRRERKPEVFKEAMVYPELDFPMYKPLKDVSADLFLPNINFVAQNSISLLETNQEFIEAYMVGLNHEFSRELLWREFPTDQRGSYFRQFWDVSDFNYDPEDEQKLRELAVSQLKEDTSENEILEKIEELKRESLLDIPPIHRWNRMSTLEDDKAHLLGKHDHREKYIKEKLDKLYEDNNVEDTIEDSAEDTTKEEKNEVVLVIRGELLKKYPNAVIYAHKAQWQPTVKGSIIPDQGKERILIESPGNPEDFTRDYIKTPLYEAQVEPDIYFFGFDLTAEVARGLIEGKPENLDDQAGWYFVIKERPGEPRFGLDIGDGKSPIEVWNDMSWEHILQPVNEEDKAVRYIKIDIDQVIAVVSEVTGVDIDEKQIQHDEDEQLSWHSGMNSSDLAYILYQAPVMMAVHAIEMLPKND